jgi:hypothetical protein
MASRRWSMKQLIDAVNSGELPPVLPAATAFEIYGIGVNRGYESAKSGDLPFPVHRYGRVYKVPTAGLLRALGIDDEILSADEIKQPA